MDGRKEGGREGMDQESGGKITVGRKNTRNFLKGGRNCTRSWKKHGY